MYVCIMFTCKPLKHFNNIFNTSFTILYRNFELTEKQLTSWKCFWSEAHMQFMFNILHRKPWQECKVLTTWVKHMHRLSNFNLST